MSCAINCGEVELTHSSEDLDCKGVHPAGSDDLILFWCLDNVSDFTNTTQINNAIAGGEALRVSAVKFGNTLPSPTLGPKPTSCGTPRVLHNTYTTTITDYSYNAENAELYEALGGGRKVAAILARDCGTNPLYGDTSRVFLPSSGTIAFSGGLDSQDDDDNAAFFQVTGTLKGGVAIIDTPAGVFI